MEALIASAPWAIMGMEAARTTLKSRFRKVAENAKRGCPTDYSPAYKERQKIRGSRTSRGIRGDRNIPAGGPVTANTLGLVL
jgi:hypothetical protein